MAKNTEQKEKLIRFYRGTEGEEAAVKLVDLAEQVLGRLSRRRARQGGLCPC